MTFAANEQCLGAIADSSAAARSGSLSLLREGLERAVASGELPRSTQVERLSRFYLSVVQGMAVQARDGASEAELKHIAKTAMLAWPAA